MSCVQWIKMLRWTLIGCKSIYSIAIQLQRSTTALFAIKPIFWTFAVFSTKKKFGLNLTAFYFHIRFERWNIYRISIHYSVCVGTTFAYKSPTKICGQMFCINSCANDKRTSSFNETENPKWNWCKIHATGAQNISRMKWIKVDGVCGTRFGFLVIYKFLVRLVCDMLLLLSVAAYLNTAMKFP